ncbi:MAG: iron-containing alcohol dehydrogenase [Treponema sp.]|jgi:alcohol dehydrogenase class IV|nr:iron-containing alcohol dehydrogenase [Treponema sp.]
MICTYKLPTELFFGGGAALQTGEKIKELGLSKVLLVTDKGVLDAGVLGGLEKSLKDSGVSYTVFSEVEPEPTIQGIEAGVKMLKDFGAQGVIGAGGGSALDSAKAIAAMGTNCGKIFDYVGFGKVPVQPLPIIAVPTTAGTGSEATFWSVLADKTCGLKLSIGGWNLMPSMAIVDYQLTETLPPGITAATGIDALVHAMESYTSTNCQPIAEATTFHAIKLIARSLRQAVWHWKDTQAREDMIMGSMLAAMAFNITRLGNAHALAIPLGIKYHIPHGRVNAILLPWVMEFNLPAVPEKYIEIARIFGEKVQGLTEMEAAKKSVKAVKELLRDIGITEGLKKWNVAESELPEIAAKAVKSDNVKSNPRKTNEADLIRICINAMNGLE